jgi:hypothetical protein
MFFRGFYIDRIVFLWKQLCSTSSYNLSVYYTPCIETLISTRSKLSSNIQEISDQNVTLTHDFSLITYSSITVKTICHVQLMKYEKMFHEMCVCMQKTFKWFTFNTNQILLRELYLTVRKNSTKQLKTCCMKERDIVRCYNRISWKNFIFYKLSHKFSTVLTIT